MRTPARGGRPARSRAPRARARPLAARPTLCPALVRSGPTTVLVLSLLFIAFVVLLHIWGKFRKG